MSSRPTQPPTWDGFGEYLRSQRQLARLTLRQLAALTKISNPYLSQLERGLHKPSLTVMKAIADALNVSVEALLEQAGVVIGHDSSAGEAATESVIRNDRRLSSSQKAALLSVYRSMVQETVPDDDQDDDEPAPSTARKRPSTAPTDPPTS
ncbi:MAG: helix-turn-helix domain-containing protein [Acidimicrobiia bacterium]